MAPILPNLQPNLPTLAAPRAQTPADRARTDRSEFRELLGRERGADRGRGLKLGHDPEHRAIGRRRKEDGCTCPGDEPSTQPTQPTTPVDDAPATDTPVDPPSDSTTGGSTADGSTGDGATGGAQTDSPNGDATGGSAGGSTAGDAASSTDAAAKPDAGTIVVGAPGTSTIDATAGVKADPSATTSVKSAGGAAPANAPTDTPTSGMPTTPTADASNASGTDPKAPAAQGATAATTTTTTTTANEDAGTAAAAAVAASASDAASSAAASKAGSAATTAASVAGSASAAAATDAARAGSSNDPLARLVEAGQVAVRDTRRAPESATAGRLAEVEASIARDRVRAATGMPSRDGEGAATGPTVPGEGLALGLSRAPGLARDAAELPKGLASGFAGAMGAELADDSATPASAQLAAKGAELLANQRGGTITMRLDPPELGVMRIEIRIAEGAVFADFEAQNPEARALLESNLSMLRRRLESQGLAVERLTVHGGLRGTDAAQPGSRQDGSETRQQGSDGRERGEGSGARQDAAGGESRGRRDGDAAQGRERMDMRSRRGESGGFAGVLGGIDDAPRAARRAG